MRHSGTPLVSVIIAARNARDTVPATLRSVLRQTLDDIEVIVIDDGSTDGTWEVAAACGDRRVSVQTTPGRGASAARNLGLAVAKGRYVSFLDADDLWTPDKLSGQWTALVDNQSAVVAYSWTILIDECGEYLFAKNPSRYTGNVHRDLLTDLFLASGSNIMIDRERVRGDLRFDESLAIAEDWDFQLRIAREHDFIYVPAYQILYRLVHGSRSARAEQLATTMCEVAKRELTFESRSGDVAPRVDATIHEYIALQCLLRGTEPLGLRTAARHWAAAMADPSRLFNPRAYLTLALLAALSLVSRRRRRPAVQRLLRLYGRMSGRAAVISRVAAARDV